jgi:hypothetical protein
MSARYTVRLVDGSSEEASGEPRIHNGVLYISDYRNPYSTNTQVAWPLTSVLSWRRTVADLDRDSANESGAT